ncbi:hypothetical protein [Rhizorhapis sp. SPR117]|uniref:hypothetical protein n=1 Tax=Rhizorhapis sp. SPR117 TaxID=2912611 RepID=UPI00403E3C7A
MKDVGLPFDALASTRGQTAILGFEAATLTGLASNGGLYPRIHLKLRCLQHNMSNGRCHNCSTGTSSTVWGLLSHVTSS